MPERAPLDAVARLIAGAQFVVGVDTGLLHLAAALGVPLVAIFAGSKPGLTGPVGNGPLAVLGAQGQAPTVEAVKEAAMGMLCLGPEGVARAPPPQTPPGGKRGWVGEKKKRPQIFLFSKIFPALNAVVGGEGGWG